MKKHIFKKNFSKILLCISIILMAFGILVYRYWYNNWIANPTADAVIFMVLSFMVIITGFFLFLINIEDKLNYIIFSVAIFCVIVGLFFSASLRVGVLLLVLTLIIYLLINLSTNIFSTLVTSTCIMILFAISALCMMKIIKNEYFCLYIMFSLFVVFYRALGVVINRKFIEKCLGKKEISMTYDGEQLKNQILLLYLIVFTVLNVLLYMGETDETTWNLINNSFLTGLAIIQIDWNRIFWEPIIQGTLSKKINILKQLKTQGTWHAKHRSFPGQR
jgi:hypothetical protein